MPKQPNVRWMTPSGWEWIDPDQPPLTAEEQAVQGQVEAEAICNVCLVPMSDHITDKMRGTDLVRTICPR